MVQGKESMRVSRGTRMITVLYVDGDPKIYPIISHIFENCGSLSVFPSGSGEEALGWLSGYHADVIVSGYDLPAMNGIEFLQAVRQRGITAPFIFFSERDGLQVQSDAYDADVFGFIARKGTERKPMMNLLRLILWAGGSHETDFPFSHEVSGK
jgi:CheY-like chemotaxis protein